MKNNLIKVYSSLLFLLASFLTYAQPGSNSNNGDLETTDTPTAPIDTMLYVLVIIGIVFALYKFRAYSKKTA